MPCEDYEELQREFKYAREEYAQFAYEENRMLRGVSDSKARQIAKAAKEKMSELTKRMQYHRDGCEKCKQ